MNHQSPTVATSTLCAQIPKAPIFAAVRKDSREMDSHVHVSKKMLMVLGDACLRRPVKNFPPSLLATVSVFVCDPKCDDNADCKNFTGTPSCMCKAGFDGDGITCTGKLASTVMVLFLFL